MNTGLHRRGGLSKKDFAGFVGHGAGTQFFAQVYTALHARAFHQGFVPVLHMAELGQVHLLRLVGAHPREDGHVGNAVTLPAT